MPTGVWGQGRILVCVVIYLFRANGYAMYTASAPFWGERQATRMLRGPQRRQTKESRCRWKAFHAWPVLVLVLRAEPGQDPARCRCGAWTPLHGRMNPTPALQGHVSPSIVPEDAEASAMPARSWCVHGKRPAVERFTADKDRGASNASIRTRERQ